MSRRPALSKGELEVARVVWELGEGTVGRIFEACRSERQWNYTTVQTYLRRLEAKGYLQTRRDGRNKIYSPKVKPSRVVQETIDDLMNRLFDGETMPLMRHLIQERGISREELEQLRELLNQWEAEQDESE